MQGLMVRIVAAVIALVAASTALAANLHLPPKTTDEEIAMTERVMPEDRFWALIGSSAKYQADPERQLLALREVLEALTPAELEAFERAFHQAQLRAYTWDLWGAAYVIHGGASDDGFEYFQRWLISKGRTAFEAALSNPDSLADMSVAATRGVFEFEDFAYVASHVWGEKTGINPRTDPEGRFPYTGGPPAPEPAGIPFEEDESYLAAKYPKLWARFGHAPLQ